MESDIFALPVSKYTETVSCALPGWMQVNKNINSAKCFIPIITTQRYNEITNKILQKIKNLHVVQVFEEVICIQTEKMKIGLI